MTTRSCDARCGRGDIGVVCAAADKGGGAGAFTPTGAAPFGEADGPRDDGVALTPSVPGAPSRPIVTCTYATPSGASGQETLTQLPRLRNTGIAVPRETCPMTGVPILGPL